MSEFKIAVIIFMKISPFTRIANYEFSKETFHVQRKRNIGVKDGEIPVTPFDQILTIAILIGILYIKILDKLNIQNNCSISETFPFINREKFV